MISLFVSDVPLSCVNTAAIEFNIPAKLIIAVLHVERGKNSRVVKNSNGSYDIGPMQINSLWLNELQKYGITRQDLQFDPCINVKVGTWLLGKAIASDNHFLNGVGNYHSRTPMFNNKYVQKIKAHYTKINMFLKNEQN